MPDFSTKIAGPVLFTWMSPMPQLPESFRRFLRAVPGLRRAQAALLQGGRREASRLLRDGTLEELAANWRDVSIAVPVQEIFRRHYYALPLLELLSVGAICKVREPRRIMEIGTYTGSTTLVMAMNTAEDCEIFTLDLPPSALPVVPSHSHGGQAQFRPGSAFHGSRYASRIHQLFGDSTQFDLSPYYGTMDLVLIDANHSYPFASSDSRQALKLLRSRGVIIWDDYIWDPNHPECEGVSRWLHEQQLPGAFRLEETRFAIYVDQSDGSLL